MSYVDFGGGEYQPPDFNNDPGVLNDAGRPNVGITDPSTRSGGVNQNAYDAVSGYYRTNLGRDPENQDVLASWVNGLGAGGSNLAAVEAAIKNSAEAKAYASRTATTPAQSADWIKKALTDAQSTDDENYWRRVIGADPKAMAGDQSAIAYWQDRIARGDGALAVRNGTMQKFQDGGGGGAQMPGGPNPGGYTDASSQLYLNQLLQRLQQLNTPTAADPVEEMLKSLAMQRVNGLQQAPYTQGQDAALVARYREPATMARDAQKQQAMEDLGRRGIGPTSGVFQTEMAKRDNAYQQALAGGDNALAVQAVQESQRRQDQALAILNSLVGMNRTDTDRQNALRDQAVSVAQGFPNFDNQRLNQLLQASGSGDSASSVINNLTGLGTLNLNATNSANGQSQANAQAWAKILAGIFGSL